VWYKLVREIDHDTASLTLMTRRGEEFVDHLKTAVPLEQKDGSSVHNTAKIHSIKQMPEQIALY